ncbi:hypothetical protein IP69_18990 [Bosea sp. AAP35]|uniref:putative bifunctional diguanylate cyclase/phosphodiesterase n=1 Tax=Bosea sp. AAP35 TaxID=1523417 RepID=UPI0006CC75B2|nr:GGDEF domain-containing phosphodiesterase [Bosea sp. AAP35]KPF63492.1 hypothetical protein IP69_18990 [Bosea sp. AAP35]
MALFPIVRRNYLPSLFVNFAASVAVSLSAASAGVAWVWWWLGFVTLASLLRIIVHVWTGGRAPSEDGSEAEARRQILIAGLGMLVGAAGWAVLGWLLLAFPDPLVRYSTSIILAGMAAGAIGVLALFALIGPLYISILMVPGCVRLMAFGQGEAVTAVIGLVGLIFTVVMIVAHRGNRLLLMQSVQLGQRNTELMAQVLDANQTLENKVRERTETLKHQASHDLLTGLLNRRGLSDLFSLAAEGHCQGYVYFLDLNRFKRINDTLGHEAGDYVLREVAARLVVRLPPDAMVGRWGGDELVILIPAANEADRIDSQLVALFAAPFVFYGQTLDVSASIGVARCPENGTGLEELIRAADLAAAQAKRQGSVVPICYDPSLAAALERRERIADDIRSGLDEHQFWLAFQPIVGAATGELRAFEALIRWAHPTLGHLSPDEFISIAEESNQIGALGAWVLDRACEAAALWHRSGIRAAVAVNCSVRQLVQPDFIEIVRTTLARHGLAASWLHLEVTESVFMPASDAQMLEVLNQLDAIGICLAVDDFGTGYSSLARLRDFPIRQIKIDRSFIADIDGKSRSVIEGAVLIARRFDLQIVAEGVETPKQAQALLALGIDAFQGYLIGRPVEPPQPVVNCPWISMAKAG